MGTESRRFARNATSLPITLSLGDARSVHGFISNLSILGMYVRSKESLPEGAACSAAFEIEPMKRIDAQCSVVHRHGGGIGLEFTGIENASFEYLRAYIVAHSADPQACEDDILANMGSLPALY